MFEYWVQKDIDGNIKRDQIRRVKDREVWILRSDYQWVHSSMQSRYLELLMFMRLK